jgi:hypothetical protein
MGKFSDVNLQNAAANAVASPVENASWTGNGSSAHSSQKMCVDAMADLWSKAKNDNAGRFKRELTDLLFDDHSKPVSIEDLNSAWKQHIKDTFAHLNKTPAEADKWLADFEINNNCE